MKYLKDYKIFEHTNADIIEDLREICYDITDYDGFIVSFYTKPLMNNLHKGGACLSISLKNHLNYDGFSIKDVEDVIFRIKEYLEQGECFYNIGFLLVGEVWRVPMVSSDDKINNIYIDWSKKQNESKYKILESRFDEFKEVIATLKDICQEFEDNNCPCEIEPKDEIKLNIISLNHKGTIKNSHPFYIEINIDKLKKRLFEHQKKKSCR